MYHSVDVNLFRKVVNNNLSDIVRVQSKTADSSYVVYFNAMTEFHGKNSLRSPVPIYFGHVNSRARVCEEPAGTVAVAALVDEIEFLRQRFSKIGENPPKLEMRK